MAVPVLPQVPRISPESVLQQIRLFLATNSIEWDSVAPLKAFDLMPCAKETSKDIGGWWCYDELTGSPVFVPLKTWTSIAKKLRILCARVA